MGRLEFARRFKQLCPLSHQGGTMESKLTEMCVEDATSDGKLKCLVIGLELMFGTYGQFGICLSICYFHMPLRLRAS